MCSCEKLTEMREEVIPDRWQGTVFFQNQKEAGYQGVGRYCRLIVPALCRCTAEAKMIAIVKELHPEAVNVCIENYSDSRASQVRIYDLVEPNQTCAAHQ